LGAISKGQKSSAPTDSSLTIGSGWTINLFGPLEDLAEISVMDGAFNVCGNGAFKNLALKNGEVNIHDTHAATGTITLDGGNITLCKGVADNSFNSAIDGIQSKMVYIDPVSRKEYKGAAGEIVLDASNYPWQGNGTAGNLVMDDGSVLEISVVDDGGTYKSNSHITILGDESSHGIFTAGGGTVTLLSDGVKLSDSNKNIDAIIVQAPVDTIPSVLDGMIAVEGVKIGDYKYLFLGLPASYTQAVLDYDTRSLRAKSGLSCLRTQTLYCAAGAEVRFVVDQLGDLTGLFDGTYNTSDSPFEGNDGGLILSRVAGTAIEVDRGTLTLDFQNDPLCPTAAGDGEENLVKAHIYAKGKSDGIAINLADGANLTIGTDSKIPTIVACGNDSAIIVRSPGGATGNVIDFLVPV
jgi:hypothetical protein